jgi:DUF917 family protein
MYEYNQYTIKNPMYDELINYMNSVVNVSPSSDLKNGYVGSSQIEEVGDVYIGRIVLAGFDKSEIKIEADNDFLTVSKSDKVLYSVKLRNMVDIGSITSKLENGILHLTMPKKEVGKSVEIQLL